MNKSGNEKTTLRLVSQLLFEILQFAGLVFFLIFAIRGIVSSFME